MQDLFQVLSSPDVNWWTECYDVFIRLSFWRHPFTAEHPLTLILTAPIHCRASIDSHSDGTHSLMQRHISPNLMKYHSSWSQMNGGRTHFQCFWLKVFRKCIYSGTAHQSEHTQQRCRKTHIPVWQELSQHYERLKPQSSVIPLTDITCCFLPECKTRSTHRFSFSWFLISSFLLTHSDRHAKECCSSSAFFSSNV